MLEKKIEQEVCKYAKERGLDHYKFTSPNRVGVPDRMFVGHHGHAFFIEFKQFGKTPTACQQREIDKLQNRGFPVYVVDNVEQGKLVIEWELLQRSENAFAATN